MTTWDELDDALKAKPREIVEVSDMEQERIERLGDYAERLHYIREEMAENKALEAAIVADIERLAGPTDEGHPVQAGDWMIEVTSGERWSWDKDLVEQLLDAKGVSTEDDSLPDFVDRSATINRRRYEKAPEDLRAYFAPALTRKEGKPTVKVTPKDPSKYRKDE